MSLLRFSPVLTAALLLGACVSVPSGPSVMVLTGTGKSFDQFRADDMDCRQFAYSQVGGTDANQVASESAVKSAAVGTVIGAAAGAADRSAYGVQRRYDYAFIQCMYAKGHKVPVSGRLTSAPPAGPAYAPPPPPPPPPR